MEHINLFWDYIMHMDKHLELAIQYFGPWVYVILFLIIFCETGLVFTPILPGDSLLFTTGTFSAQGALDVTWIFILLSIAAILGDTLNYWIGCYMGPKVFYKERSLFLNKKHLEKTHHFFEKHGGKTIILARFMPIIRTFAPFVAGIGSMTYWRFLAYNIVGGIVWVALFVFGGYYFGNLSIVKHNFPLVIMAIIVISIMPGVAAYLRNKYAKPATMK